MLKSALYLALAVVISLPIVGCNKEESEDSASSAAEAESESPSKTVAEITAIRDEICGCDGDAGCTATASQKLLAWAEKNSETTGTTAEAEKVTALTEEALECMSPAAE